MRSLRTRRASARAECQLTRIMPRLARGESWQSSGGLPGTSAYDEEWYDRYAWFHLFDEWGGPVNIPCIVCGEESKLPCAVPYVGGKVLFGACSEEHADQHFDDLMPRVERARQDLLDIAEDEPQAVVSALRIWPPETPEEAIRWAQELFSDPYRPPAVLDVETTGLDRTIDEIIEIGAVDGTGRTLIDSKIKSMKPISAGAAAKHHISASDLLSAPTLVEYWPQISEALTGRTIICYNIEFDIDTMLITNAARSGLRWFPAASACAMNAY